MERAAGRRPDRRRRDVASRAWLGGRVRSDSIALGRAERAAITWSTSISVPATTAVSIGRRPSGATTAAASSACSSGSEPATR